MSNEGFEGYPPAPISPLGPHTPEAHLSTAEWEAGVAQRELDAIRHRQEKRGGAGLEYATARRTSELKRTIGYAAHLKEILQPDGVGNVDGSGVGGQLSTEITFQGVTRYEGGLDALLAPTTAQERREDQEDFEDLQRAEIEAAQRRVEQA